MISVKRLTLKERFDMYMENPESLKSMLSERLKSMPDEEVAYILAAHDRFENREGCAEYENAETGLNPLGVKVDPWGRPVEAERMKREDGLLTINCGRNYDGLSITIC